MSSDSSETNDDASEIICGYEYDEFQVRSEINWLTRKIKTNPNNLKLYQKKAFVLSAQANYQEGSEKIKLLIDLSNCQNQIIELFPLIDKQNLNDKNFQEDYSEDDIAIYDGFTELHLTQIIDDRNKTIDQIQKMVENAKQLIAKLDQEILLEPQNYELYLEKAQQQLILAYQKLEQQKFIEEIQKSIKTFQIAILNHANQQNLLLKKKLEFCQQILKSLDVNSLEYLEIVFQIMQIYDEQTQLNTESSQSILYLKLSSLWNEFSDYDGNLTSESIKILKNICQNCLSSIKKQQFQNKRQQIHFMCLEAKIYMTFAKVFTKDFLLPIDNNIEFQIAQKLYQEIICILGASQSEFSNELEYMKFKLDIYQNLQSQVGRDQEKVKFQEQICQIQQQICEIIPSFDNLNSLGIKNFQKVYKFEQLLEIQKTEDVEIFNKQIFILDKILELDLNAIKIYIYAENPFSKAVNHKCKEFIYQVKLLLKLNRNLEALSMSKKLIQNKDINQIEEICSNLLIEQSNFREAEIVGRLTSRMRGLYVCQTMKNEI